MASGDGIRSGAVPCGELLQIFCSGSGGASGAVSRAEGRKWRGRRETRTVTAAEEVGVGKKIRKS